MRLKVTDGENCKGKICKIEDEDFCVEFNGKKLTVEWNWTAGSLVIKNDKVACYKGQWQEEEITQFEQ